MKYIDQHVSPDAIILKIHNNAKFQITMVDKDAICRKGGAYAGKACLYIIVYTCIKGQSRKRCHSHINSICKEVLFKAAISYS